MNILQNQEICSLAYLMKTGNKHVVIPSPDSMIDILDKVYQHRVSRRTHFRAVHALIEQGLIVRQFRYDREAKPTIIQKSSMISFTLKGVKYLMKMGVLYAYTLYKKMIAWLHKDDSRFPKTVEEYKRQGAEAVDMEYNLSKVRSLLLMLEASDKKTRGGMNEAK